MVRQMFAAGVLQSGFWHQFAMTAHSPVGMSPEDFKVKKQNNRQGRFANNDLVHSDPTGADHDTFSYGLKKSLLNYMHGIGLDFPLQEWFEFKVPRTSVPRNYVALALAEPEPFSTKPTAKIIWLGKMPTVIHQVKSKKGQEWPIATLTFQGKKSTLHLQVAREEGAWLCQILPLLAPANDAPMTFQDVKKHFEEHGLDGFELFWYGKQVNQLHDLGLLVL
jgi:hypothetical protein